MLASEAQNERLFHGWWPRNVNPIKCDTLFHGWWPQKVRRKNCYTLSHKWWPRRLRTIDCLTDRGPGLPELPSVSRTVASKVQDYLLTVSCLVPVGAQNYQLFRC